MNFLWPPHLYLWRVEMSQFVICRHERGTDKSVEKCRMRYQVGAAASWKMRGINKNQCLSLAMLTDKASSGLSWALPCAVKVAICHAFLSDWCNRITKRLRSPNCPWAQVLEYICDSFQVDSAVDQEKNVLAGTNLLWSWTSAHMQMFVKCHWPMKLLHIPDGT